jgi:flavin reductase (DIM6/NTAB) family NADH-FMN oxidoreductase RutF
VSVLTERFALAVPRQASTSDRDEPFTGLQTSTTDTGAHLIEGATAWMECSLCSQTRAGDQDVVLLRVHALGASSSEVAPLVWHGSGVRTPTARTAPLGQTTQPTAGADR